MATMRQVDTRIWKDNWIRKLNALDRYAFIYLLTNDNCSWCGIYELPLSVMAFESGIDERDLENSILPKLSPKILYINGWVCITNFIKYHDTGSPNSKKGIENAIKSVPEEIMAEIKKKTNSSEPFATVGNSRHTSSSSFTSTYNNFSNEKLSEQITEEPITETYKTKKKIFEQKGLNYTQPKKSTKQETAWNTELLARYLKDQTMLLHGVELYINKKDSGKHWKSLKEAIKKFGVVKCKEMVDFYLNSKKYNEWGSEPNKVFSDDSINIFNRSNNLKQKNEIGKPFFK